MPDPSQSLLERLGFRLPETRTISPEEQALIDRYARQEQEKLPWWKRFADQAIEGISKGLTGDEFDPSGIGRYTQLGTEILGLGALPGPALMKKLGLSRLTHGSPAMREIVNEGFNPDLNYRPDTLGWMTHLAERPGYSSAWAEQLGKAVEGAGVIPAVVKGRVADLLNPDIEDLTRIAGASNPWIRKDLIGIFKQRGKSSAFTEEELRRYISSMSPEQFERTGLDAVRYKDFGETAWAVSRPHNILSVYGKESLGGNSPKEFRYRAPFIASEQGIIPPTVREVTPEKQFLSSSLSSKPSGPKNLAEWNKKYEASKPKVDVGKQMYGSEDFPMEVFVAGKSIGNFKNYKDFSDFYKVSGHKLNSGESITYKKLE
jgi:hypothetical protein